MPSVLKVSHFPTLMASCLSPKTWVQSARKGVPFSYTNSKWFSPKNVGAFLKGLHFPTLISSSFSPKRGCSSKGITSSYTDCKSFVPKTGVHSRAFSSKRGLSVKWCRMLYTTTARKQGKTTRDFVCCVQGFTHSRRCPGSGRHSIGHYRISRYE